MFLPRIAPFFINLHDPLHLFDLIFFCFFQNTKGKTCAILAFIVFSYPTPFSFHLNCNVNLEEHKYAGQNKEDDFCTFGAFLGSFIVLRS